MGAKITFPTSKDGKTRAKSQQSPRLKCFMSVRTLAGHHCCRRPKDAPGLPRLPGTGKAWTHSSLCSSQVRTIRLKSLLCSQTFLPLSLMQPQMSKSMTSDQQIFFRTSTWEEHSTRDKTRVSATFFSNHHTFLFLPLTFPASLS